MYLFCDVDGVLIPFPAADGSLPPTHQLDHVTPDGYTTPVPIWLDRAHGPLLDQVITATSLKPVWCASWREDASRLIAGRLGLPPWPPVELPHLPITTSHPHGYLWKRDFVAEHAREEPLAWIDDDFADPADYDWASARTSAGMSTLLVQPDPQTGLQLSHIDTIRRWALSNRTRCTIEHL